MAEEPLPLASPAAFVPRAAPLKQFESKILTLDDADLGALGIKRDAEPAAPAAPAAPVRPKVDRLAVLRDLARKLRSAPDSEETLQTVIDDSCRATGSDAGMLTVSTPRQRQFVAGTALGAGPYINVPLRVGGPTFGELVLTRMAEGDEYESEDETFAELVAEYIAKAVSTLRAGTVLSQESQDFVDRVTEELRPPLAGAVGTVGIALGGDGISEASRPYLKSAHNDITRLLHTVDNLQLLAHLRPPRPADMQSVPVDAWLERCVEARRHHAEDRGVSMTLRPPGEAHLLTGVPEQLDNLLGQLLGNAIKFTDEGGRVDVSAGLSEGMIKVTVRDNGIGFDPGEAPRMLECFARSLTADAGRYPGLGIGLFVANNIATQHGGRIWLESKRDEGTSAHIALPPRVEAV